MYLSIYQLDNNETVSTTVRLDKTTTIGAIRLGLYKHDTPDGTLTLALKDGATEIASQSVTMASLDAAVGTYFHGYVKYEFDGVRLNKKGTETYKEITLEVTLTSHTDDDNNYIALQRQIEGAFVPSYGTIPYESDRSAEELTHLQPFMVEIFELK